MWKALILSAGVALVAACSDASDSVAMATPGPEASATPALAAESIAPVAAPVAEPVPAASAVPVSRVPAAFRALGTEPFWSAAVAGTRLTYTTPEDQQGKSIAVTRSDGPTRAELSGILAGAKLALEVTPGTCSDGMSDRVYPFTATLTIGGETRHGCAIAKKQIEREPTP
jgi:uncharacterized membrane protein